MSGAVLTLMAPELILLVGACAVLLLGLTRAGRHGSIVGLGALVTLAVALFVTVASAPPDPALSLPGVLVTPLTHYVRLIGLGVGLLIVLLNWFQPVAEERGEYHGLVLLSLLGVLLTASANDLLVLFFAIELVSVPTYVLVGLSRLDGRAPEAAVKYFFLGAFAAAVLAYGLTFLYGQSGTTTLLVPSVSGIASNFAFGASPGVYAVIGLLLVFFGLAFKVVAVPFHVYAPDVYEGAAAPMTAMLGFVPKLAGFVALVKVFGAMGWDLPDAVRWVVWVVAAATMTVGNVLALLQSNAKRMLAYSSIAHTGYMLIALLVGPVAGEGPMRDGVAALLFYIGVYGVMNLGAFAMLAAFTREDREVETVNDISGLARRSPAAALAFAVCILSLMGFPPTAGFLGKLYIFSSAFSVDLQDPFHGPLVVLAVIGVLNTAVSAAYYLRLVGAVYVASPISDPRPTSAPSTRLALALCGIAMVLLFLRPSLLIDRAGGIGVVPTTSRLAGSETTILDEASAALAAGVNQPDTAPISPQR
jgi:NADH-quinone oxidoreductase subunit N